MTSYDDWKATDPRDADPEGGPDRRPPLHCRVCGREMELQSDDPQAISPVCAECARKYQRGAA